MLSKEVSSTISKVLDMTWPGIEPMSPGSLANTLPTRPMSRLNSTTTFLTRIDLTLNNPGRLICHKTKKRNRSRCQVDSHIIKNKRKLVNNWILKNSIGQSGFKNFYLKKKGAIFKNKLSLQIFMSRVYAWQILLANIIFVIFRDNLRYQSFKNWN